MDKTYTFDEDDIANFIVGNETLYCPAHGSIWSRQASDSPGFLDSMLDALKEHLTEACG